MVFSNTKPRASKSSSKFPDCSADYQSTQYDDLYFLGPLGHILDFRKAAGGFIHGFRYTGMNIVQRTTSHDHSYNFPLFVGMEKPCGQMALDEQHL